VDRNGYRMGRREAEDRYHHGLCSWRGAQGFSAQVAQGPPRAVPERGRHQVQPLEVSKDVGTVPSERDSPRSLPGDPHARGARPVRPRRHRCRCRPSHQATQVADPALAGSVLF
jgi:hypothetical protein